MTTFDESHSVIMMPHVLANLSKLSLATEARLGQNEIRLIEDVENIMQA